MRQVLSAFRRYGATVTVGAILAAAGASPAAAQSLPPCAGGSRVVNFGTLALSDCSISGQSTPGAGGGIENYGSLTLTNVVIAGNAAANGGGLYNGATASVTLMHVMISGNTATGVGGGLHNDGGTVYLNDVVITGNTAGTGGGGVANVAGATIFGVSVALVGNGTTAGDGGGLLNDASVCLAADFNACFTVTTLPGGGNSLVSNNTAGGNGGGVANQESGSLILSDSTLDNNTGSNGGGVSNLGTLYPSNLTISRNTATGHGGGLYVGAGSVCCVVPGGDVYTINLTIAGNHAAGNGGGVYTTFAGGSPGYAALGSATIADNVASAGGGVYNDDTAGGFTQMRGTLLARNGQNCAGTLFSDGYNLDTGTTCGLASVGDQSNVTNAAVGLGTLSANGGPARGSVDVYAPLLTLALDPTSPAVDAAGSASEGCPATDERLVTRPQGSACDIGAFELAPTTTTTVTATITAANKVYDATTVATITTCTLSGVQSGDDVSCTASDGAFDTANVGTAKPVTATVALTGSAASHYQLSSTTASTTANITPAPASVTPNDASKAYGTADPPLTGTPTGFFTADHVTATYSRTAGETVAGSPYPITATLSATGTLTNYTVTYNVATFTITKATASVTPNAATKVYGTADPAFTGTLTGFLAADGVTATYSRTAGESVAGSPYAISATLSPTAALANYTITYNTANFTITKATASVTPNAATKVYGAADPAFTGTLSGFLAADAVTASYSRTAGESVAGSPYTISAVLSPAGVLGNYTITSNTASFTITKATASVTPNPATKVYGSADPAFTGTLAGFLAADAVTATYSRTAGETVAGSPYTISATLSPAGALANYIVTYNTAAFSITKATASVTPNAATKAYGTADPVFTGTLSGFLAADGVTATYSRTPGETVAGSPYTISATLSPAAALANYTITSNTADFSITKVNASVTPNAASKTYGTADPAFTGTLTGFLAADGVTATYSRTAGESVAGSPYTISATLSPAAALANYTVTYNTAAFTITKATASVTPNAASKTYGAADPAFTGTLAGFLAADGIAATYSRTAGESVAGSPYTISAVLSPAGVLGNYTITSNTASFTITKATASVTPNPATKVYGAADPAFTGTLSGFLAADGITATYSRTAGESVAGSPYTISATLSPAGVLGNYTITSNTASFTITKATASVTPNPATKVYGSADPAFTGTLAGFLAADGITATYSRTAGETVAGSPYTISATLSPAGALANYTITYNTAAFTITKATASVTPNAASKTYGAADPVFGGTLVGFLAADGVTATYSRTAGESVAGSPYAISAVLSPAAVLANYTVTYNTAAFTITKATASVTPNAASKTYGAADPAFTGTLAGFLAADRITATYSRTAGESVAGSPYTISGTLSPAGALENYTITYNTAAFTITKVNASVTPNAASKTYGTADPAFTGTLSGFLAADGITATYSRTAGESVAGSPYAISAVLSPAAVLANYTVTYNTAAFTITKATASVTPNGASKTYGAADPAFTGTLAGFLAADGVTATYSRTAGETVAGSPYTISATLSPTGALANYTITYNTANFTITKATASVTPNAATKVYGAADPAFTGTLAGFLAADGVTATYSRTAGETVAGSPYTISAVLSPAAALANYTITYNTAAFTIAAPPTTAPSGCVYVLDPIAEKSFKVTSSSTFAANCGVVVNSNEPQTAFDVESYSTVTATSIAVKGGVRNESSTITPTPQTGVPVSSDPLAYLPAPPPPTGGCLSFSGNTLNPGLYCGLTISGGTKTLNPGIYYLQGGLTVDGGTITGSGVVFYIMNTNYAPVRIQSTANATLSAPTTGTYEGVLFFQDRGIPSGADYSAFQSTGTLLLNGALYFPTTELHVGYSSVTTTINGGIVAYRLAAGNSSSNIVVNKYPAGGSGPSIFNRLPAYVTYTQSNWHAAPSGNNAGTLLANTFGTVYPQGVTIGASPYNLKFTSAAAIRAFLPAGGAAGVLHASATNPASSAANVFAGQVLALQLTVDFSNASVITGGLSALKVTAGNPMAGASVAQVLAVANQVIAGNTAALPAGMSVSSLNNLISSINSSYVGGTNNNGVLAP